MTDDDPWLNVPQAVVLEATRDIELVLDLTAETPALLQIRAIWRLARRPVIPPEANPHPEQWNDSRKIFDEARATLRPDYLEAQQQVNRRLAAGVRTKARRTRGGAYESIDPVEYVGTELQGVDAIDKRSRSVRLFDILINVFDYVEYLAGKPITSMVDASSLAPDQIRDGSPRQADKWECTGDPVAKLIDWARPMCGDDPQKLPNRTELLRLFREQFGRVSGINEKTMREVRRQLASPEARRGGARMHRR